MKRRVTIKDVAAEAGVSVQTVSRVMNKGPNVTAAMQAKVTAAVEKLGYTPSIAAQRLGGSRSFLILALNDRGPTIEGWQARRGNDWVDQMLFGAMLKCAEYGYRMLFELVDSHSPQLLQQVQAAVGAGGIFGVALDKADADMAKAEEMFGRDTRRRFVIHEHRIAVAGQFRPQAGIADAAAVEQVRLQHVVVGVHRLRVDEQRDRLFQYLAARVVAHGLGQCVAVIGQPGVAGIGQSDGADDGDTRIQRCRRCWRRRRDGNRGRVRFGGERGGIAQCANFGLDPRGFARRTLGAGTGSGQSGIGDTGLGGLGGLCGEGLRQRHLSVACSAFGVGECRVEIGHPCSSLDDAGVERLCLAVEPGERIGRVAGKGAFAFLVGFQPRRRIVQLGNAPVDRRAFAAQRGQPVHRLARTVALGQRSGAGGGERRRDCLLRGKGGFLRGGALGDVWGERRHHAVGGVH